LHRRRIIFAGFQGSHIGFDGVQMIPGLFERILQLAHFFAVGGTFFGAQREPSRSGRHAIYSLILFFLKLLQRMEKSDFIKDHVEFRIEEIMIFELVVTGLMIQRWMASFAELLH
jgi:hypothetical protein